MDALLTEIRTCKVCEKHLPSGCNPVVAASSQSKIVVIGQAPGRKVHASGIPWDDKSGDNLRNWLGVSKDEFYNTNYFAIAPMGFCYPGTGKSGDLPPRPECAPLWHNSLLQKMPSTKLIILVGQYAQKYYLGNSVKSSLTDTVKNYKLYGPVYIPLPHPSPRNNIWQKKNPWFSQDILPELRKIIKEIINE